MENKGLLSDIYAQLSEFFKEPAKEFAGDVASGRLFDYFTDVFSILGLDSAPLEGLAVDGDAHAVLKDEYRKLFLGPLPPYIVPVESVYKRWSNDPSCTLPIAVEKGYFMGDPAMDMINRYQADGLVIRDAYASMPDHIALELEYMAFLLRSKDDEEAGKFLSGHLDWIGELARDIASLGGRGGFYCAVGEIALTVISFFPSERHPTAKAQRCRPWTL